MQRRNLLKTGAAAALCWKAYPLSALANVAGTQTLREAAAAKQMLAGFGVLPSEPRDPSLVAFITSQCNALAPEDTFNWNLIHAEPDRYEFVAADELVNFASKNSIQVHGRSLCPHADLPEWLSKDANAGNATQLLKQHLQAVVGRYAGRIHSWDVVTEAIEPNDQRNDGMRNSLWMKLLGPRYIAIAFHTVAEMDPKTLLTYNESGLEGDSDSNDQRRRITLGFLRWMRQNHIPIHALGLQSHLQASYDYLPSWIGLHAFLQEVQKLELQVFITELEIDDTSLSSKPEKREKQVAELCKDYLKNVLQHPHVKMLLTSGMVSHTHTFKNDLGYTENHHIALPLNEDHLPTAFLRTVITAIEKR
jgi:endo-1,4-beta-xylanase